MELANHYMMKFKIGLIALIDICSLSAQIYTIIDDIYNSLWSWPTIIWWKSKIWLIANAPQAYMAERSPFQLRGLLTAWNIFLAVFSIMGAARFDFCISCISHHIVTILSKLLSPYCHHIHNSLLQSNWQIIVIVTFRTLPEFIYTISTQVRFH